MQISSEPFSLCFDLDFVPSFCWNRAEKTETNPIDKDKSYCHIQATVFSCFFSLWIVFCSPFYWKHAHQIWLTLFFIPFKTSYRSIIVWIGRDKYCTFHFLRDNFIGEWNVTMISLFICLNIYLNDTNLLKSLVCLFVCLNHEIISAKLNHLSSYFETFI